MKFIATCLFVVLACTLVLAVEDGAKKPKGIKRVLKNRVVNKILKQADRVQQKMGNENDEKACFGILGGPINKAESCCLSHPKFIPEDIIRECNNEINAEIATTKNERNDKQDQAGVTVGSVENPVDAPKEVVSSSSGSAAPVPVPGGPVEPAGFIGAAMGKMRGLFAAAPKEAKNPIRYGPRIMDCAFKKMDLYGEDGNVSADAVTPLFTKNLQDPVLSIVKTAITLCAFNVSNLANKKNVDPASSNSNAPHKCNFDAKLFMTCVDRYNLINCPAMNTDPKAVEPCKRKMNAVQACDPMQKPADLPMAIEKAKSVAKAAAPDFKGLFTNKKAKKPVVKTEEMPSVQQ